MAHTVTCKSCGATAILYEGGDGHAALQCDCCPEDHHHGVATATSGIPCRPVTHTYIGELAPPVTES